jgi:glucosamine--fructose-6-phosphate aminotransferase (isomerizing)
MGFPHYMLKEIYEQPSAFYETVGACINNGRIDFPSAEMTADFVRGIDNIHIVGCGSAYHAGVYGKYIIEELTGICTFAHIASEFRYGSVPLSEKSLVIVISQSGETADSIAALKKAGSCGSRTLAIVNVSGSTMCTLADMLIYTRAGKEVAVATTKAYLCQLAVLQLLGLFLGEKSGRLTQKEYDSSLKSLSSLRVVIENQLRINQLTEKVAQGLVDSEHIYFIGRHTDYALALEGALKMKEISYIHCEAYPSGELKHGTISLIEKGTPVVAVCLREDVFQKTLSNIKEVKARGGKIIAVTREKFVSDFDSDDTLITAENTSSDNLSALAGIIPLQLLSYHVASLKKCEVDKPRNLAKSVTVE